MKLIPDFFRTRHTVLVILITATVCVATGLVGSLVVRPTSDSRIVVPFAVVLPIIPAVLLGATTFVRRTARQEIASVRRLGFWRLAHVGMVLAVAVVGLSIGTYGLLGGGYSTVAVLRNLTGLTGLALVSSAIVGPALSWILPLSWLLLPGYFYSNLEQDQVGIATFFAQPDASGNAMCTAVVLLIVGAMAAEHARPIVRS